MKIFVYNYREDEAPYFEKFSKEYGVELGYTTEYPSLENAKLVMSLDCIITIYPEKYWKTGIWQF